MIDPEIVSESEWLAARKALLVREKELTAHRDAVAAARRELPMVEVSKPYVFHGPDGEASLPELFEGRSQLLIYHFMWLFDEEQGCPSCSFLVDSIGDLSHLHARDTTLAIVTRGPLDQADAYRKRMGWTVPWYSSFGSDFNYDFHVTIDDKVAAPEYNYRPTSELGPDWAGWAGEQPGTTAFLRDGDRVFHTYSSYARGGDLLIGTYNWLDLTARGRQEDWERPAGRADSPMMGWLRRHDSYAE